MKGTPLPGRIYEAIPGFEDHLQWELETWDDVWGSLYRRAGDAGAADSPETGELVFWRRNTWFEPFRLEFDSISEAAAALRAIQRNWAPSLFTQFRRGALIASKLPALPVKPRPFPWRTPEVPMGSWTLLDSHTMIASARCSSPFPGGVLEFEEDKAGPPSRAYLKLWEALVRCGKWPGPGSRCLDAGASPGGWTWALARMGAETLAVDRVSPEDRVLAMPGVSFVKHDAFTLKPQDIGPLDWLFCDVICYPPRLYEWIEGWLQSGLCKNFVCTIKMQGEANFSNPGFAAARRFAAIPQSQVVHLYHNKHELTWIKLT
jgi:23S rRNA (cytidine2498-2'-O)-methyltransferase